MTSCTDQCRFARSHRKNARAYARAYVIACPIRDNRHTAQYCHLLAQISAQILSPTGARSRYRPLPRNPPPIGSQTIGHGEHHPARISEHHPARISEHHPALQSILYCNYRQSAINSLLLTTARRNQFFILDNGKVQLIIDYYLRQSGINSLFFTALKWDQFFIVIASKVQLINNKNKAKVQLIDDKNKRQNAIDSL